MIKFKFNKNHLPQVGDIVLTDFSVGLSAIRFVVEGIIDTSKLDASTSSGLGLRISLYPGDVDKYTTWWNTYKTSVGRAVGAKEQFIKDTWDVGWFYHDEGTPAIRPILDRLDLINE